MDVCYACDGELSDENWMPSFKKRGQRICKSCYKIRFNDKNNPQALYINGKYIPKKDPRYKIFKPGHYKNVNDAIFEQSAYASVKTGHVYVISNKAWPGWLKIGMAVDADDRLSGYQTSSPYRDYVLEHKVYSGDRRKAEAEAHGKATLLAEDSAGEWFKISLDKAKSILDGLNEYGSGLSSEASADSEKDKLQELPKQGDLWTYAENREAEGSFGSLEG